MKVVVDAVALAATVRVSVELPPAVTVAGENVAVRLAGKTETVIEID
jgi:hypothetical protein